MQQAQLIQKILKLANAGIDGTSASYREASQIINIAGVLVNQYIAWLSWGFDDGWQPRQKR
ncbi:hypothetical protein QGP82_12775 [Leptothoe sp. LEGE 181152]|nr:hypothetical protein [Leptothoe sp. LEGE 181152]